MPHPVIFTGETHETKYGSGALVIKFFVNLETAQYFLRNYATIKKMIVKIDFFPSGGEHKDIAQDIVNTVDTFLDEKEDAIKINSCFHGFYDLVGV